ncbi:glycosyltransferase family 2 protein [Macrococcoides caseolyticum]|uniref:glycosyltransferase family 2 protein n=1 Tax=Macrococcoides caseolyticum TaxID=69966 RepID=UPI00105F481C|nr:glycosyltransferase family 2 protein [Macrococcus caseolyticus]TDM27163.1 glycosyltransferase family 2 protein [Macrococcus caseolyticus]
MLISVILPVYNVEDYIQECLDSLLNQTIGEENLEIIIVNDCSTDSSEEKILKNSSKFTNFQYIKLNENQGAPGKVRNIGVDYARGDFIHFLDPDDIMDIYAYETLAQYMGPKDDFVMGKMLSFNEDGSTFQHITFREYKMNKTYMHTTLEETPFFAQVKVGVVLKLIRKSFYIKNEIKFTEGMKNGEDKLVDTMLYTCADSFTYIPVVVYHYRNRNTGDNKSLTHQNTIESIYNDIDAYYICCKNYNQECLQFFMINVLRSIFWKIIDYEFHNVDYNLKIDIFKKIKPIIHGYDPEIIGLYLNNELPIIKMISQEDYDLAISYSALLEARRRYFYEGVSLQNKVNELEKFNKSKSFKIYKTFKKVKNLKFGDK